MRKTLLFYVLLIAAVANAGLYTADNDGYTYTGTPIDAFSVDFTTWTTDSLPTAWLDEDPAHEAGGMAFVKWTLTNRSVKYNGVSATKPVCFNNGTTADATPVKNNTSTHKPRIYLPKTSRGVKKVKAIIACAKARSLAINYKDDNHTSWTYTSAQALNALASWEVDTVECELNTVGETSIFIQYGSTDYLGILSIELELVNNTSVSLDKHSLLMNTDATCELVATPLPADLALTWSSSNEAVATVADGVVTAIGVGEADIVVSGGEGVTDTCHVTTIAHDGFALGEDGYWHYSGEPVNGVDVEFSNLGEEDVYYTTGNLHADLLWNFAGIGIYKWSYHASRSCEGETYGPLLWNSGNSENGTNGAIKNSAPEKLAAIYLPEIQNGVKTLTVEGWTNNNSRSLMLDAEDNEGVWTPVNELNTEYDSYYVTLTGNTYTTAVFDFSSHDIRRLRLWRNSNDYQFLTRIAVEAMPASVDPTGVEEVPSDQIPSTKVLRDGQLRILHNGKEYNSIGQTIQF